MRRVAELRPRGSLSNRPRASELSDGLGSRAGAWTCLAPERRFWIDCATSIAYSKAARRLESLISACSRGGMMSKGWVAATLAVAAVTVGIGRLGPAWAGV